MAQDGELIRVKANHWRGDMSVGGHLTLTDELLSFRAHRLNTDTEPLDLPVADIASVAPYRSMGFIPNGVVVTTTSGVEHRFVVSGRGRLIAALESLR